MTNQKRERDSLENCTLGTLPTHTLSVEQDYDVLHRLLELLPSNYTSSVLTEQRIPEELILRIIMTARSIIVEEPVVAKIDSPVYVCGDIHGQYYDLVNIFTRCPPLGGKFFNTEKKATIKEYNFLFLGDYVDRGSRSIEVIITLLALKIIAPDKITLLRGNHEDEQIMLLYGFFDECKRRYDVRLFKIFADLFRILPVAALINESIFCMHGGLSPELINISDIPDLRPCNVPHSGIMCDLLWADPESDMPDNVDWAPSSRRISSVFSHRALKQFLQNNDIDLVCRAHQVIEEGFQFFPNNQERDLITIFSATNYCNEFGNRGGILCVNEDGLCSILTLEPPNFVQQRDIALMRDALPNPTKHD